MKNKLLVFTLLTTLSLSVFAYIPPYWMIASRTVDNHGNGYYKLDMDVVFNHGPEAKIVNERWFVIDEDNMRVEVRSKKGFTENFALAFVYNNNKKYFLDEQGRGKSQSFSSKFFEPFFHHRKTSEFKSELVKAGLVSAATLKSSPKAFDPKTLEKGKSSDSKPPQPGPTSKNELVELSRVGGTVSYKIPSGKAVDAPALWIEQDQFVITKILFGGETHLVAQDYTKASGGLHFPTNREIFWDTYKAHIHVNSIDAIGKTASNKKLVAPSSLKAEEKMPAEGDFSTDPVIKSFYSQFR